jgi:hypothetical protein
VNKLMSHVTKDMSVTETQRFDVVKGGCEPCIGNIDFKIFS